MATLNWKLTNPLTTQSKFNTTFFLVCDTTWIVPQQLFEANLHIKCERRRSYLFRDSQIICVIPKVIWRRWFPRVLFISMVTWYSTNDNRHNETNNRFLFIGERQHWILKEWPLTVLTWFNFLWLNWNNLKTPLSWICHDKMGFTPVIMTSVSAGLSVSRKLG